MSQKSILYKSFRFRGLREMIDFALFTNSKEVAGKLLEAYIQSGCHREHARTNIGYYAGYYGEEDAKRIWSLFECTHSIFGTHFPEDSTTALKMGMEIGARMKKEAEQGKGRD